ncbi:MAG: TetR/AcrR family transcriptional regulator [Solirubrobacteraceae bacterium]
MLTDGVRPLRADAQRNRAAILAAAREEFSSRGAAAQMEDIAARAGVGVGTVYRHFETKEALLEGLLLQRFEEAQALLDEALEISDPWEAFSGTMRKAAELQARDRAWAGLIAEPLCASPLLGSVHIALEIGWGGLIERGRRAGVLRADLRSADMAALMCGLAQVVANSQQPAAWRRYLDIVLDGVRA